MRSFVWVFVLALVGCQGHLGHSPTAHETTPIGATKVPTTGIDETTAWVGRFTWTQQDTVFSAHFTWRGTPKAGQLDIETPFGSWVGTFSWDAHQAVLAMPGKPDQQWPSLQAAFSAWGLDWPVDALFDTLSGRPAIWPGWTVDVLKPGLLRARRQVEGGDGELRVTWTRVSN